MNEYEELTVVTTEGPITFTGMHRPDLEKPNWHYYETKDNKIYHFRKEHMVAVIEGKVNNLYLDKE